MEGELMHASSRTDSIAPSRAGIALAASQAAPSSNIARAARRFGDRVMPPRPEWPTRLVSVAAVLPMVAYLPWMFTHLATERMWLAGPFAVASVFSAVCLLLSIVNGWTHRITPLRPLTGSDVPLVGIIIPTCGEPVPMVLRTVLSVIEQDYPARSRVIVVSDDAHNPELRDALVGLGVHYHEPPPRGAKGRDGAPKSGNLNSALAYLLVHAPDVRYIETRDADDEVGTQLFLRQTLGQLEFDPRLAFVQTVKEAQVSAGDPFCNFDAQFYRSQMLTRNATNSVFPCGSGLVWRRRALESIGGFPTWNLVEDFQSGVEALRRGWEGCYLPIVGAVGQHSPEDVPNVIKQRGTWAIDSVRLMLWGKTKGLNLRQRLAFTETLFFYLHSFTVLVYVPVTALACVGVLALHASPLACVEYLLPYALITELRLFVLNHPYGDRRQRQRHPFRALWRVKVMWIGLAPTYMVGSLKAVVCGPRHRPRYTVTRKTTEVGLYWRETLPNLLLAMMVPVAFVVGAVTDHLPRPAMLVAAGYWGIVASAALAGFVVRGWFGPRAPASAPALDRRTVAPGAASAVARASAVAPGPAPAPGREPVRPAGAPAPAAA
jgi:cellulose synthase (UDP-forming)